MAWNAADYRDCRYNVPMGIKRDLMGLTTGMNLVMTRFVPGR